MTETDTINDANNGFETSENPAKESSHVISKVNGDNAELIHTELVPEYLSFSDIFQCMFKQLFV